MKTHNSPRTFEDLQPAARTPHTPFGVKAASGEAPSNPARRKFIGKVSGLAAAGLVAGAVALEPLAGSEAAAGPQEEHGGLGSPGANLRADRSLVLRVEAAQQERQVPIPAHPSNGDEQLFSNRIGNFSKGLPHNAIGEVDPAAYNSLLHALSTGNPQDFEDIIIGGDVGLVDPQSGLAFELEGTDSHQLALGPPPGVASAETASEAVENYWMALLRDVSFTNYGTDSGAQQAANELSGLPAFKGPRQGGRVTGQTLFRGPTPGDLIGPYLSQFLLLPFTYGAIPIQQRINTYLPLSEGGTDYMTDASSWLAVQNGQGPFGSNRFDAVPRQIRTGRDISAYVHVDVLFEAYLNACIWLVDNGAPFNPGNPYGSTYLVTKSKTQVGFGTFGTPHLKALLAEVATRALKAVWFQKWFVHRRVRPEAYGGLVHYRKTGAAAYPLPASVLDSPSVAQVFARNGTYFMPHAFPEGCPQHPSYGEGHATVAGACSTIVKAMFDGTYVVPDPVVPSADGLSLVPYAGSDAGQITVTGEMDKIASNIGIGRCHAAVHWRSDSTDSLTLGEAIAISVLRDQRPGFNEIFQGFTFTKFDGTTITV